MFKWLTSLFAWLTGQWEKVPDPVKDHIIDMIVKTFEIIFREFYRTKKQEEGSGDEQL